MRLSALTPAAVPVMSSTTSSFFVFMMNLNAQPPRSAADRSAGARDGHSGSGSRSQADGAGGAEETA